MPCSGRTFPVPHFGPPIAPSRTASAALAASRALEVRGSPVASIEACEVLEWATEKEGGGRAYAAEEMFLEVEFAGAWAGCFDYFEDLERESIDVPRIR